MFLENIGSFRKLVSGFFLYSYFDLVVVQRENKLDCMARYSWCIKKTLSSLQHNCPKIMQCTVDNNVMFYILPLRSSRQGGGQYFILSGLLWMAQNITFFKFLFLYILLLTAVKVTPRILPIYFTGHSLIKIFHDTKICERAAIIQRVRPFLLFSMNPRKFSQNMWHQNMWNSINTFIGLQISSLCFSINPKGNVICCV